MPVPEPFSAADELERVADALTWSVQRDDWWGPARLAFDAEVMNLRDTARALAAEVRGLP